MLIIVFFFFIPTFSLIEQIYQDYRKYYDKSYPQDDIKKRLQIFTKNYNNIVDINKNQSDYTLKLTIFSDMTQEEIQQINNVKVDENNKYTNLNTYELKVSTVDSFDWRDQNVITSIKNQGKCGCCWAFSSTSAFQSEIAIRQNKIYDLSEQYVLQCTSSNNTCSGGYVSDTMNFITQNGIPNQTQYPYIAANNLKPYTPGICQANQRITLPNLKYQVYNNVSDSNLQSLILKSTAVVLFYADIGFMHYNSGIYSCSKVATSKDINHAVQLIGFDIKNNYYIIKNSYGTNWGINGFGYINASMDCGLKLFVYQYVNNELRLFYFLLATILFLIM